MVVAVRVVVAMSVVVAFRGLGAGRRVGVSVSVVMIVVVPVIAVIMIVARLAGMVVVLAHASFPLEGSAICSSISFRTSLMCASAAE